MCATEYGWRYHVKAAAEVIAHLAESNGSLPPCGWLKSPVGWLPVHRDQLWTQMLRN